MTSLRTTAKTSPRSTLRKKPPTVQNAKIANPGRKAVNRTGRSKGRAPMDASTVPAPIRKPALAALNRYPKTSKAPARCD